MTTHIYFVSESNDRVLPPCCLPANFTLENFTDLIWKTFGCFCRIKFIVRCKELNVFDENRFNEQKYLITNNCTIFVGQRFMGGCFLSNTLITRVNGTSVPISTIQPGDDLLAFSYKGEVVTTTVEEVFVRTVDDYVELKVGEDKTVSITSDHWAYVGNESFVQLKNLHTNDSLFVLSNTCNTLSTETITSYKSVTAKSTCVYNLHTAEPHTYFANSIAVHNMSGNMGMPFVDVSNAAGIQHIKFSETAPRWRIAERGLCLEGKCLNRSCVAYQQLVIINIGVKQFNLLKEATAATSKCPICSQYVEPTTCGFNNCFWRWWGMKKPGHGLPPIEIPPCDWKEVGDEYQRFNEKTSGQVSWLELILDVSCKCRRRA